MSMLVSKKYRCAMFAWSSRPTTDPWIAV